MLTGDTLKFGTNGDLLDGQNRLRACITSGIPMQTRVVFGIDPVAFKYLDTGTVHTSGDTFKVAGVRGESHALADDFRHAEHGPGHRRAERRSVRALPEAGQQGHAARGSNARTRNWPESSRTTLALPPSNGMRQ
jgi:hypothetical protein